jgi:tetratricopeptide (TPR) repeat protein
VDERRMDELDELDDLVQVRADTPLFEALMASLERAPLPVDAAAAAASADRLGDRLGSHRASPWLRLGLGLGFGAAAFAAAAAAGLALFPPTGPPQPEDVVPNRAIAPSEAAALPPAPPDVVQAVRDLFAAEDWLGAWNAAAGVQLSEEDLRKLAVRLHVAGHQGGDPATLEAASAAYELYLAAFPEGPMDDEMRYAYGELLYKEERFPEAYDQYLAVADRHPESKRAKFCAESALFAAERLADPGDPRLDRWEERMLDAADLYIATWPDDPKAVMMSYRAGYLLLAHGRLEGALPHMISVITTAPEAHEATLAATLLMDAWRQDAVAEALAAAEGLSDEASADLLEGIAAALEAEGRADEAAALRAALGG